MKIPQREIVETDMEYIARLTKYTFMLENEVSKYRYVKKRLDELYKDLEGILKHMKENEDD